MLNLPAWSAALLACALVGLGLLINSKVWGFLPDDPPGEGRKRHGRPMPLAGVLLGPPVVVLLWTGDLPWLAAGAAVCWLTGYLDDRRKEHGLDLRARTKGAGLLLACGLAALQWQGRPWEQPEGYALLVFWLFALTNAANFLDNTDGVCASLSGTSLLLAAGAEGPLAAAGFVALGFLPWNWPRPRAFLGDSGALTLGLVVAAASGRALPDLWRAALPVAVQWADFLQVVIARLVLGYAPWIGDRRHVTHMLHHAGMPRVLVAPLVVAAAVGVAAYGGL